MDIYVYRKTKERERGGQERTQELWMGQRRPYRKPSAVWAPPLVNTASTPWSRPIRSFWRLLLNNPTTSIYTLRSWISNCNIGRPRRGREEERNAHRSCGWDGAAEKCRKPSAVWAPPLGDTARTPWRQQILPFWRVLLDTPTTNIHTIRWQISKPPRVSG